MSVLKIKVAGSRNAKDLAGHARLEPLGKMNVGKDSIKTKICGKISVNDSRMMMTMLMMTMISRS